MILPDFTVPPFIGLETSNSGIDTYEHAIDKNHYNTYPYDISYKYNSRGYRDEEWPENLNECIWCVGDSFTNGIGQPFEHIWPQILQQKLNHHTINISMDGASNHWISRKILRIADVIRPKTIIAQWTFPHRTESNYTKANDYARRMWFDKHSEPTDEILQSMHSIRTAIDCCKNANITLINSIIPFIMNMTDKSYSDYYWNEINKIKSNSLFVDYNFYDHARDGNHYGVLTATDFVDNLVKSKYINTN